MAGEVRGLLPGCHPVFDLVDRQAVESMVSGAETRARRHLEQTLSLATWLDIYQPDLRLT